MALRVEERYTVTATLSLHIFHMTRALADGRSMAVGSTVVQ